MLTVQNDGHIPKAQEDVVKQKKTAAALHWRACCVDQILVIVSCEKKRTGSFSTNWTKQQTKPMQKPLRHMMDACSRTWWRNSRLANQTTWSCCAGCKHGPREMVLCSVLPQEIQSQRNHLRDKNATMHMQKWHIKKAESDRTFRKRKTIAKSILVWILRHPLTTIKPDTQPMIRTAFQTLEWAEPVHVDI